MIFEKVKELLAEQLDVDAEKITLESSIIDDLGADSLDIVEMLMEIEEKFNITIPDEDAQSFRTISDVVKYIEEKQK